MAAYDVNYDDERFTQVNDEKQQALTELEQTYTDMIDKSDQYYKDQINASEEWVNKQTELQNQNTEFAIEKIEQQKEQAQKDYIKEQAGAYADWRKQSNEYGVEAEKMASSGLQRTGFSESSQVSMYNAYQNRVATARDAIARATLNFENGIKEAQLQNNSAIAEIRFNAYKQQLELSLQGFQYKNQLIETLTSKKTETEQMYYNRYLDVLAQINQENAMAEEIRQYNESLALQKEQLALSKYKSGTTKDTEASITKSSASDALAEIAKKAGEVMSSGYTISGKSVNQQSVNDLGRGPINEAALLALIKNGRVLASEKNGQVYVKNNPFFEKMKIFG